MKRLSVLILVVAILAFTSTAFAGQVTKLKWDAVTTDIVGDPITVTGYKAYCKTSGEYVDVTPVDVGNVTESLIGDVIGDSADNRWYCVLTAYTPTAESAYSNEVSTVRSGGVFYRPSTPVCPCPLTLE